MDPDVALLRLLDALAAVDREEATSAALDLAYWLQDGGFLPDDPRAADRERADRLDQGIRWTLDALDRRGAVRGAIPAQAVADLRALLGEEVSP